MNGQEKQSSFPYIPLKNWWDIRAKFAQAVPTQLTLSYLGAVLGIEEKSARNLIPQFRAIGIIDDDGKPTELSNDWRMNEHYAEVCKKMLEKLYPDELRDLFPPPNPDKIAIRNWFMRKAGIGQNAANKMAIFYHLLCQADPSAQIQITGPKAEKLIKKRELVKQPSIKKEAEETTPPPSVVAPTTSPQFLPSIHINIQIHISADAKAEQIDNIFASMAKYLPLVKMS
jgi:hypothetical protein